MYNNSNNNNHTELGRCLTAASRDVHETSHLFCKLSVLLLHLNFVLTQESFATEEAELDLQPLQHLFLAFRTSIHDSINFKDSTRFDNTYLQLFVTFSVLTFSHCILKAD